MPVAKIEKLCFKVNLSAPQASRSFFGVALFFHFSRIQESHFLEFRLWSASYGNLSPCEREAGEAMLEMAGNWVVCQGLDHASLESITKALEGALRESVLVKGTVKTSCSPESCSADSASLLLWSHCLSLAVESLA